MGVHQVERLRLLVVVVGVVDAGGRYADFLKETHRAGRGIDLIPFLDELACRLLQRNLVLGTTDSEQHRLLGNALTDRQHCLEQCVVGVFAEAAHLARRCHIYAQYRVGILQAVERELRGLDPHILEIEQRLGGFLDRQVQHNAGGYIDEIDLQHLRHEWERAGGTQVALDDLNLVVPSKELDIEGARYVQFVCYLARYLFDTTHRLHIEFLGGEHNGGVARVYAGELDMLRYGVGDNLTVPCHSVHLDLLGIEHKLGDDNGMLRGYFGSKL